MNKFSRRDFLRQGAMGLAVLGAGGLLLRTDVEPTEPSGDLEEFRQIIGAKSEPQVRPTSWRPTEDNILGPFFR